MPKEVNFYNFFFKIQDFSSSYYVKCGICKTTLRKEFIDKKIFLFFLVAFDTENSDNGKQPQVMD